jgi:hypothetical protein
MTPTIVVTVSIDLKLSWSRRRLGTAFTIR